MSNIRQILEKASAHPILGAIARVAIALTGDAGLLPISHGEGAPQSSREFAKTYAIRRSMGYFGKKKVSGLDETIELLNSPDRAVRLSYVQMEKALISIWLEEQGDSVCGLLIIESTD